MKKVAYVDREKCVACGACVKVCPKGAISVYRGCYAVVEEEKCIGCGKCGKTCPGGFISGREKEEA